MKPAICTQCGGTIEVDETKEAGICLFCGTAYITEKVINNYYVRHETVHNITENVTKIVYGQEKDEGSDFFKRGLTQLKLQEYVKAKEAFQKAVDLSPERADYRFYLLAVTSYGFECYSQTFDRLISQFFSLASEEERQRLGREFGFDLTNSVDFRKEYVRRLAKSKCAYYSIKDEIPYVMQTYFETREEEFLFAVLDFIKICSARSNSATITSYVETIAFMEARFTTEEARRDFLKLNIGFLETIAGGKFSYKKEPLSFICQGYIKANEEEKTEQIPAILHYLKRASCECKQADEREILVDLFHAVSARLTDAQRKELVYQMRYAVNEKFGGTLKIFDLEFVPGYYESKFMIDDPEIMIIELEGTQFYKEKTAPIYERLKRTVLIVTPSLKRLGIHLPHDNDKIEFLRVHYRDDCDVSSFTEFGKYAKVQIIPAHWTKLAGYVRDCGGVVVLYCESKCQVDAEFQSSFGSGSRPTLPCVIQMGKVHYPRKSVFSKPDFDQVIRRGLADYIAQGKIKKFK